MVEVLLEFGVSSTERTNDGKLPSELTQNKVHTTSHAMPVTGARLIGRTLSQY